MKTVRVWRSTLLSPLTGIEKLLNKATKKHK